MHPQSIYNMPPKRLNQLIDEVLAEIEAEGGMENVIRKGKAVAIEDLFRVKRLLGNFNRAHFHETTILAVQTFDEYYDLTLEQLEVKLAWLSAKLTRLMQWEMRKNNRASWNIDDSERDIWR